MRKFISLSILWSSSLAFAGPLCLDQWTGRFSFSRPLPVSAIDQTVSLTGSIDKLAKEDLLLKADLDRLNRIVQTIAYPVCGQEVVGTVETLGLEQASSNVTGIQFSILCQSQPKGNQCGPRIFGDFGDVSNAPVK